MKRLFLSFAGLAMVVLAGCNGSVSAAPHTMGKPPAEGPIVAVADVKPLGTPVTVHGTMIEKCPVAGCWFMLRDKSGVIKIDTKNAGFVVSEVPVNTEVTVTGVPAKSGERRIAASGMRY
jgi:uncharacterized protein YdeI (BOF family)